MNRYSRQAIIAIIALSLFVIGTNTFRIVNQPYETDKKTVADILALDKSIIYYQIVNLKLPATLNQLDVKGDLNKRLKNYEYVNNSGAASAGTAPANQESFSLCATFQTSAFSDQKTPAYFFEPKIHGKGHQCFSDSVSVK